MSQSRKKPQEDFAQISANSQIHQGSSEVGQNTIIASKGSDDLDDETMETSKLIRYGSPSRCKSFCLFSLIVVLVIALIVFASLAFNCILSKQNSGGNNSILATQNTTISIDNGTRLSKQDKQMEAENAKQKNQISALNIRVADLQFELKNLKNELEKEKSKPRQIHDQTYLSPNNQTNSDFTVNKTNQTIPNPPINQTDPQPVPANTTKIDNATNITNTNNSTNTKNATQQAKPSNSSQPLTPNITQDKPKFTVRSQPRKSMPKPLTESDRYEFTISIDDIVAHSPISFTYPTPDRQWSSIKKPQYERAIRLMEVVHNVNFKGEIVLDHYKFYKTPEDKYDALTKILKEEKEFYDKKYQTSKYIHDQIGICVYLPSYNNAKNRLYLRNLDSVFQQEYKNYHVVYVNDASTDGTGDYVKAYMEQNEIPKEKYVIINNEKNKGNCANIYMAAHNYCNPGEIMILLDGDDVLIGRQVFSLLNAVYQKEKIALTYGQFLLVRNNQISSGFSRDIPYQNLQNGNFRQLRGFFTSHLKTMYVDVMREIKVTDLQYANGTYYDYASDVAYMTPAIELVGTRLKFLKELNYEYRFDTGSNEPHQQQIIVQQQVYQKPASKKMQSMPFADKPKTIHYD